MCGYIFTHTDRIRVQDQIRRAGGRGELYFRDQCGREGPQFDGEIFCSVDLRVRELVLLSTEHRSAHDAGTDPLSEFVFRTQKVRRMPNALRSHNRQRIVFPGVTLTPMEGWRICSRTCGFGTSNKNRPHRVMMGPGGGLAEREGFEPSIAVSHYDGLANVPDQQNPCF